MMAHSSLAGLLRESSRAMRVFSMRRVGRPCNRFLSSAAYGDEHREFLSRIAKAQVPSRLDALLDLLPLLGLEVVSPFERKGLNPLLVPVAKNHEDGSLLCFLRWPTQKDGMDLQLVRTNDAGVSLVALSTDHFCHKHAVEMDLNGDAHAVQVACMVNQPSKLYNMGDIGQFVQSSKFPSASPAERRLALDRYLLTKVGAFPDCYQRLADNFLASKNAISAMVTAERAVNVFYSWGQPMVYHSKLLLQLGRPNEARDGAKTALSLPKWTLAHSRAELEEVIKLAGFSDVKMLGDMHLYRSKDARTKDIEEGVSKEQVLLDQAAHLMDAVTLGSFEGGWDAARPELAQRYRDGGYPDIAAFLEH